MDGNLTDQSDRFPKDMPSAPPPPPEVKVRTMQSDLDAMARSGGGAPHFETVAVTGLSIGKPRPVETVMLPKTRRGFTPAQNLTIIIIVVTAATAAIITLCYLAWRIFFVGTGTTSVPSLSSGGTAPAAAESSTPEAQTPTAPAGNTPATTQPSAPAGAAPAAGAATTFVHATLFKKAADQTLTLTVSSGGAATTAEDLESFSQKIATVLSGASSGAHMIEIVMNDANGNGLPVANVLAQENASFLGSAALADFNPDATFFAYQDANGFWPGIVLALKPGSNVLAVKNDVRLLESSPSIPNFFLSTVGAPSSSGFLDSTVSGTPVRALPFPSATPPATFLYGWYQSYLIISTSRNGFATAMNLL